MFIIGVAAISLVQSSANNPLDTYNPTEQMASYTIYKYGDTTLAKNGSSSRIDFESVDSTYVIQSALDAINSTGGMVFIKTGSYKITGLMINGSSVGIVGEGQETRLIMGDHSNANGITIANKKNFITISSLSFIGNSAGNTAGSGIFFNNTYVSQVNQVWIYDFAEYGVHTYYSNVVNIFQSQIDTNKAGGVFFNSSNGCKVSQSVVELNTNFGVKISSESGDYGQNNIVDGNWLESQSGGVQTNQVYVGTHSYSTKITNNIIVCLGLGSNVIVVNATNAIFTEISNNHISSRASGAYAFYLVDCLGVSIINNYYSITEQNIYVRGASDVKRTDYVLTNERYGVAQITAGNQTATVTHGLDGVPDVILCMTSNMDYYVALSSKTSTSFTISLNKMANETITIYWYAWYNNALTGK